MNRMLVLSLQPAAKIYVGLNWTDSANLFIEGISVRGGFAPWPASPDILYHSESRQWVGITYAVPKEYQADIRMLCEPLDPGVVRYDDFVEGRNIESYGSGSGDVHSLEIVWGTKEADAYALAQLSDDTWYYNGNDQVLAIGLSSIDDTLKSYNLSLPSDFSWPSLQIDQR